MQRRTPLPARELDDSRLQEIALYEAWLGSVVASALASGNLSENHRLLLAVRQVEGNQSIWAAAGELGEPLRSYVARLFEIEELLSRLDPDLGDT